MKYVVCDNTLYGMSDKKFVEYLEAVAAGEAADITDFGKVHGEPVTVTTLDAETANTLLAEHSKDSEAAAIEKKKAATEKRIKELQAKLNAMNSDGPESPTTGEEDAEGDVDIAVGE